MLSTQVSDVRVFGEDPRCRARYITYARVYQDCDIHMSLHKVMTSDELPVDGTQ